MNFKRLLYITILIITVTGISLYSCIKQEILNTSANASATPKIILDAGHGGFDGGAVANDGTVEKDINLKITMALYDMLTFSGYDVILTRQTDSSIEDTEHDKIAARKKSDMKNRLELMKKNDDAIFVSIHLNKFTTSAARGSQVFYSGNDDNSKILGDNIQNNIIQLLQPENTRINKCATKSTYLLYNATIPAVLVECGFISNSNELQLLKSSDYQKKMAFCIYCGINNYFSNLKEI